MAESRGLTLPLPLTFWAYRLTSFIGERRPSHPSYLKEPFKFFVVRLNFYLLIFWIWLLIWGFPSCFQRSFLYVCIYFQLMSIFNESLFTHRLKIISTLNFCSTLCIISLRHLSFLSCDIVLCDHVLFPLLDYELFEVMDMLCNFSLNS